MITAATLSAMTTPTPTHRPSSSSELMTVYEVADRLEVSPGTVRNWDAAGYLERVKFGPRLVRYRRDDIERFARIGLESE